MNKFLKKICSVFLGAALFTAAVPGAAFADTVSTSEEEPELTLNPVVVQYIASNTKGKEISAIGESTVFNLKLTIKDIKVKTSQISGAGDIDFIKTMDTFKGNVESVNITSTGDELLRYDVVLTGCRWLGGSTSFGFMVGYKDSGYTECSVTLNECKPESDESEDPVINVAEPMIKITAVEPDAPIKAGDTGEFRIKLKNLGSTAAYNILAEITPSDDILIIEGTGTQDIESLDFKEEKVITIKYKALDKINSLKQVFGVSLRYYYDNGTSEVTGSASSQVSVAAEVSTTEKVYPVITTDFSLAETEIEGGKEYSGVVTVKNSGSADMKGLFVSFSGSDDIIITGGTGSRYFADIPVNTTKQITVKFRTMDEITTLRQELRVSLKYNFMQGSEELEGTYEQSFIMFGKGAGSAPLPIITSKPLSAPLEAGKQYRKAFYISNKGNEDMKNITIRVKGSEGLTITGGCEQFFVDSIKAGGQEKIMVYFNTNADLVSVNQTLDIEMEYYYERSGVMTAETKNGTVMMNSAISAPPVLRISGDKLEAALVPDTEYEYKIYVTNYGDITVRDVFIDFTSSDGLYFLDGTESANIGIIRPGDSEYVKVKFRTLEDITSIKQTITAEMKYAYGRNTSIVQKEGSSSLTLIAAANKKPGSTDNAAAPNIIIGRYDIGADQIAAGDVFTLSIDFYNTNAVTNIENLVMSVNASGDLSIYGGSNSFYYPTLAAAGSASESVQLRALPTALTGTSSVSVSFKYDYVAGESRVTTTSEQSIFVPIYQPDKMTFSVSKPTYDIYSGNEVYLTLSYINKGRADAANVKVEITSGSSTAGEGEIGENTIGGDINDGYGDDFSGGSTMEYSPMSMIAVDAGGMYDGAMGSAGYDDGYYDGGYDMGGEMSYDDPGFTALSTEKVIGNVAAGGNGTADFVITPTRAGEVTVVFRITYEDSNMNEIVKEVPVTLNVQEQMWYEPEYPMTMEMPDEGGEGGFPWWAWLIIGGGAAVAAVVVIVIVVNVRKKKGGKKKYTADDIDWEDDFDESTTDSSDKTTKV